VVALAKGVSIMAFDPALLEKIDALYDMGRDFVERPQLHGFAVEYQFDTCAFDQWRRQVNDLLYSLGGCEDIYYQRFSKEVTQPHAKALAEGLRILAAVRDEIESALRSQRALKPDEEIRHERLSVSYH
jgi:hypothetical protein